MDECRVALLVDGTARLVPAAEPVFSAFDLGPGRGDGVFETMLVSEGGARKPAAHLARLARSAELMGMPAPDVPGWQRVIDLLAAEQPTGEAALKLMLTRGIEGGEGVTAVGTLRPLTADMLRQRREGISVVTLTLGIPGAVRTASPWLLGGVKYLSYAVNMAALRHAGSLGADDVIFLTVDGDVMEGPTSTVVWAVGDVLHTPPVELGILPGTTQAQLFERAASAGFGTAISTATVPDLMAADAVWMLSSIRGAAAVTSLDGVRRSDAGLTTRIQTMIDIR